MALVREVSSRQRRARRARRRAIDEHCESGGVRRAHGVGGKAVTPRSFGRNGRRGEVEPHQAERSHVVREGHACRSPLIRGNRVFICPVFKRIVVWQDCAMNTIAVAQTPTLRFSKARVVAARLGVCTRTLFRWANQGKFARHKVNARLVLFNEAEVESFIRSTQATDVAAAQRATPSAE